MHAVAVSATDHFPSLSDLRQQDTLALKLLYRLMTQTKASSGERHGRTDCHDRSDGTARALTGIGCVRKAVEGRYNVIRSF